MFYYDIYYIVLVLPMIIISMIASQKVNGTYKKYSRVQTRRNFTATEAVRQILDNNGLYDVKIEHVRGNLTDHYDPKANVVRLSDSVMNSSSVAAVGVAAHEAGHAVQHAVGYAPVKWRSALVPVANFGSRISIPLIILGFVLMQFESYLGGLLVYGGILFFAAAVVFQIVTLPVEFDASNRAIKILSEGGYLYDDETGMVKKVLSAAAFTYVAAAATSIAQLLRLILIARDRD
ncbi:MAG: zinc metallopeptidase [Clostridia bacterium]